MASGEGRGAFYDAPNFGGIQTDTPHNADLQMGDQPTSSMEGTAAPAHQAGAENADGQAIPINADQRPGSPSMGDHQESSGHAASGEIPDGNGVNGVLDREGQFVPNLPHFISLVIICGMLTSFSLTNGLFNDIVVFFGGERSPLLSNPEAYRPIYIISGIWREMGWKYVIIASGLAGRGHIQIAKDLNITLGAERMLFSRTRKKVRTFMEERENELRSTHFGSEDG